MKFGALTTRSKFYYGWKITISNRYIDFNDGAAKTAVLKVGTYTAAALGIEIAKQMDAVSVIDFNAAFNRSTRQFTISGSAPFTLPFLSGTNAGQSTDTLLGFTHTDKSAASSYTSEGVSASEYKTQFILQSYKDTTTNRKAIDGVINKSAGGNVELVKFGNERFMSCEALFITDLTQEIGSIIRENTTGVQDFISMMEYITEKSTVEFMKDESDTSVFESFILESTESDSNGLNFDLIEMYDRSLSYYFRSGLMVFRKL